ncbi:MAG: acyltransferase [Clostridia bacterium]|nr:acyltransferase [Clostridia bacterium]
MNEKNTRSYPLDFLKLLATIAIVFHHFQQINEVFYPNHINFFGDWFYWGYLVEFFFILSGYFMHKYITKIQEEMSLSLWFAKRAKRLLPLVAVSALVFEVLSLVYYIIFDKHWWGIRLTLWGTVLTSLGIQEGWVFVNPAVNSPTWYISVLMLCYIIFYLLTRLAKKINCSPLYLYIGMVLLGCAIKTYDIALPFLTGQAARGYYSFFFGLLLAHFIQCCGIPKRIAAVSTAIVAALTALFVFFPSAAEGELAYLLTFMMFPAIIILFETTFVKRIFSHSFWGVCGAVSFNIYIWHVPLFPLLAICLKLLNISIEISRIRYMYIFALIAIAVGIISHYFIEKPLNKFIYKQIDFFKSREKIQ